jgi:hypothetical protein
VQSTILRSTLFISLFTLPECEADYRFTV